MKNDEVGEREEWVVGAVSLIGEEGQVVVRILDGLSK